MTSIVILAPIYWWETDSEKGLRILQINYRTKIYTEVQIPHFCYSTAATENKLIDNPWSIIFPFCIEMYTNLLGKCSTQTLTLKHFLCISVPQFTNFLSGSFISFLYLTDNVRCQICNPNTKITRQMSQHKTIKTPSNFHQSELALLGQQKLTIITPHEYDCWYRWCRNQKFEATTSSSEYSLFKCNKKRRDLNFPDG